MAEDTKFFKQVNHYFDQAAQYTHLSKDVLELIKANKVVIHFKFPIKEITVRSRSLKPGEHNTAITEDPVKAVSDTLTLLTKMKCSHWLL